MSGGAEDRDWQRLDRWLWCARFHRTRALAARFAGLGKVRINRQPTDKPHARVRPGDVLTFAIGPSVRVIRVVALGDRRGPAAEARALYIDLDPPGPVSASATPGPGSASSTPGPVRPGDVRPG